MTDHDSFDGMDHTPRPASSDDDVQAGRPATSDEPAEPTTPNGRSTDAVGPIGGAGATGASEPHRSDRRPDGGDDDDADIDGVVDAVVGDLRRGPNRAADDLQVLIDAAVRRADAADLVDVAWTVADTPVGALTLAATDVGVVQIAFGDDEQVLEKLAAEVSPRVLHLPARLDDARRQLDEYFGGRLRVFDLRLDRRLSHGYRRRVLDTLAAEVGYGQVATYKELAERTGNPRASRAVGTAMATNPIPIVVPCHRVLRTGGALGGYGGGLDTKAWLLDHEGATLLRR